MYWILAAIFLLVTLAVPRLRPLSLVGCVILGVLLVWGVVQRLRGNDPEQTQNAHQRGRSSSPATVFEAMPLTSVDVEQLQLLGGGAPFELHGRVTNKSRDTRLRSITIRVTRRDCYEGALDPTGCAILWQDRNWLAIVVPPQETRDFVSTIWMHGSAGRSRGSVQDSFEVVAVAGEPTSVVQSEPKAEEPKAEE